MRIGLFSTIFALAAFGQDKTPGVDEIIAKHNAARGVEKIKASKTIRITGVMTIGGQFDAPMTITMKQPNLVRVEMTVQGQGVIQAFDGKTAWMVNPMAGVNEPSKADEDAARNIEGSADINGALADWKQKGHSVELAGREDVEGKPAYRIKLTKKNGQVEHHWIFADNWLAAKSLSKTKQMGTEVEVESYYRGYREIGGVMTPSLIEQNFNGQPMLRMKLEKYEADVPVEYTLFQMPRKPEAK